MIIKPKNADPNLIQIIRINVLEKSQITLIFSS